MRWKFKWREPKEWNTYFAIFPVRIGPNWANSQAKNGDTVVWLEFVERRFVDYYMGAYSYEYRLKS